jgi:hypothetical protein
VGTQHHGTEDARGCADDAPGTEQHVSLSEDLQLPSGGKSAAAPAYVAVLMVLLPEFLAFESHDSILQTIDAAGPPPDTSPLGIRLSHTVALLI